MLPDPANIIDLKRYPLDDPGSDAYAAAVAQFRQELGEHQYCVLPHFVTAKALAQMVSELRGILPDAYRNASHRNCYLQRAGDASLPQDHPRNLFFDAGYRMLAFDLFHEHSLLRALYNWPAVRDFVAGIVEAGELYPSDDPYQPMNVLCYGEGDRSAWHFDSSNAFTMTLMLQAAQSGGEFEIAPNTRLETTGASDPYLDKLRDTLSGARDHVAVVPREPGALVIFRGCTSVHRVTAVEGDVERLMAVFVYEDRPGVTGDPEVNRTVYGPRVASAQASH